MTKLMKMDGTTGGMQLTAKEMVNIIHSINSTLTKTKRRLMETLFSPMLRPHLTNYLESQTTEIKYAMMINLCLYLAKTLQTYTVQRDIL